MRTPRTLTTVAGLALVLALSSCGASGGDSSSGSSPDASGDAAEGGQAGSTEAYQDAVETRRADLGAVALEEKLSSAAESGEALALDVMVHRAGDTIEKDVSRGDGEISMAFVGEGDGVDYEIIGKPEVFGGKDIGQWPPLRGEFSVESSEGDGGTPSYTLTRSGEVEPAPRTGGEMCQSEDVDGRAAEAAASLSDASLEEYAELRDQWAAAPQLWGTIKGHAATGGGEDEDILGQLCAPHRE